jgi:chromosome segregation ATPase
MAKSRLVFVVLLFGVTTATVIGVGDRDRWLRRVGTSSSNSAFARRREALRARARRLSARVLARLDEIEQFDDEHKDQKLVGQKAAAALDQARRELDLAERALKEYQEVTHPQDLAGAASDIAQAELEARLLTEQIERNHKSDAPETKNETAYAQIALARVKTTLEQAKAKQVALKTHVHPRRLAELTKELERTKAEVQAKRGSLNFERQDEAKLERQSREGALSAPEREAMQLLDTSQALLGRLRDLSDSPEYAAKGESLAAEIEAVLDRAEREWRTAETARGESDTATTTRRVHAAAGGGDGRR